MGLKAQPVHDHITPVYVPDYNAGFSPEEQRARPPLPCDATQSTPARILLVDTDVAEVRVGCDDRWDTPLKLGTALAADTLACWTTQPTAAYAHVVGFIGTCMTAKMRAKTQTRQARDGARNATVARSKNVAPSARAAERAGAAPLTTASTLDSKMQPMNTILSDRRQRGVLRSLLLAAMATSGAVAELTRRYVVVLFDGYCDDYALLFMSPGVLERYPCWETWLHGWEHDDANPVLPPPLRGTAVSIPVGCYCYYRRTPHLLPEADVALVYWAEALPVCAGTLAPPPPATEPPSRCSSPTTPSIIQQRAVTPDPSSRYSSPDLLAMVLQRAPTPQPSVAQAPPPATIVVHSVDSDMLPILLLALVATRLDSAQAVQKPAPLGAMIETCPRHYYWLYAPTKRPYDMALLYDRVVLHHCHNDDATRASVCDALRWTPVQYETGCVLLAVLTIVAYGCDFVLHPAALGGASTRRRLEALSYDPQSLQRGLLLWHGAATPALRIECVAQHVTGLYRYAATTAKVPDGVHDISRAAALQLVWTLRYWMAARTGAWMDIHPSAPLLSGYTDDFMFALAVTQERLQQAVIAALGCAELDGVRRMYPMCIAVPEQAAHTLTMALCMCAPVEHVPQPPVRPKRPASDDPCNNSALTGKAMKWEEEEEAAADTMTAAAPAVAPAGTNTTRMVDASTQTDKWT